MATNQPAEIVGILNVTPDSFSDGGQFDHVDQAVTHGLQMIEQGATVLDVGGESTRPGAQRIHATEQIRRVVEPIRQFQQAGLSGARISIDTTSASVAAAALEAGASIINDVSAGREDPMMFELAAAHDCPIILMHMLGQPATMQRDPRYNGDVVEVVREFLLKRADAAQAAGVTAERIVIDPGIGFGKSLKHNLRLLANLNRLVATGYDVMLGASRKRFVHDIVGDQAAQPMDRLGGTVATTVIGVPAGVRYVRVHDVVANVQAAKLTQAIGGFGRILS